MKARLYIYISTAPFVITTRLLAQLPLPDIGVYAP